MLGPFGIDDDVTIAETHFGMDKPALGVAHQHARLEAEGRPQPGQCSARIFIENA